VALDEHYRDGYESQTHSHGSLGIWSLAFYTRDKHALRIWSRNGYAANVAAIEASTGMVSINWIKKTYEVSKETSLIHELIQGED